MRRMIYRQSVLVGSYCRFVISARRRILREAFFAMMGVLVAVGYLTASQAWGQSACQQLGVNCNWNSQSQGDSSGSQSTGQLPPWFIPCWLLILCLG
jgi:hypothetical protein